jgi:hypothetical protein
VSGKAQCVWHPNADTRGLLKNGTGTDRITSIVTLFIFCSFTTQPRTSFVIIYCFLTIYSRYLKRVISKRDGCEYLKQVPSIDGSLELI